MSGKSEVQERINVFTKPAIQNRPAMFTHQTPEPRYVLDPQGVSPHLRGQATPR